jgi:glycosyltransferase involved in cell wall biosynthesis
MQAAGSHGFVVMAYGDSPFLAGCLRSLQAQSLPTEVVVATSTPSDFIDRAAADHGVRVIVNPVSEGIAADWNFALSVASSRRVTLAHQDDVYFPRFAECSLARMIARPEAVACFTGYEEIDDDGAVTRSKISAVKHLIEAVTLGEATAVSGGRLRAFLALGNALACSSVTFDLHHLGGFRFSNLYRSNLDWDAWLRLAEEGAVLAREPERLVGRRHNALTATSRLLEDGSRRREDLMMFRRLWPSPLAEVIAYAYRAGY